MTKSKDVLPAPDDGVEIEPVETISSDVTPGDEPNLLDDEPDPAADGPIEIASSEPRWPNREELLVRLLGERRLALGKGRYERLIDRIGTAAIVVIAALTRLVNLGTPGRLVFDEYHYLPDAWSLWQLGFEARWPEGFDRATMLLGESAYGYLDQAAYVVHPQVGKWLIGLGIEFGGGVHNPAAWRLGNALIGIIAVLLVIRVARRLFASTTMGLVAGLLMAIDGTAIVHSRTGLLDQHLMFFALLAFFFLLLDRDWSRRRLAERTALMYAELPPPKPMNDGFDHILQRGPRLGFRYWRLAAGISLGLACGVKWSGIYFVAVFGLLTVLWDFSARRRAGIRLWALDGLIDGVFAFFAIVPTAIVTYVASWFSWFATPGAWNRQWAVHNPDWGWTWLPDAFRSFWRYHLDMWNFHHDLTSSHPYQANPFGFIVQWRPTSFYWGAGEEEGMVRAITSIGNPLLWWMSAIAIPFVIFFGVKLRDWRALAALSGTMAGWLPWVFTYVTDPEPRLMFTFWTIAFTPFVVLTLVYLGAITMEALGRWEKRRAGLPLDNEMAGNVVWGNPSGFHRLPRWLGGVMPAGKPSGRSTRVGDWFAVGAEGGGITRARRATVWSLTAVLLLIVIVSWAFYPVWVGSEITRDYWAFLIRFRNWI
ncbi:MAG: phospholipid carrier-dependent glycosyltransferase [Promicromonosporaceae bacterium]|nr:phospholipid carrier-dependent glycosyltransferase [Promicromonosporaceae bacterium]